MGSSDFGLPKTNFRGLIFVKFSKKKQHHGTYAGAYKLRNVNTKRSDRVIHAMVYPNT